MSKTNTKLSGYIGKLKALLAMSLGLIAFLVGQHTSIIVPPSTNWESAALENGWVAGDRHTADMQTAFNAGSISGQLKAAREYETVLEEEMQKVTAEALFKPDLALSLAQNKLCLALIIYTEAAGEPATAKELVGWAGINRAIDSREDKHYINNICAVAVAKGQFSGMSPYARVVSAIVWGKTTEYIPKLATKNNEEMIAWDEAFSISGQILNGALTRKHKATHFISFRSRKSKGNPSWVKAFKPVSVSGDQGLTTFYRDYGWDRKTGEKVFFTKEKPYWPKRHR